MKDLTHDKFGIYKSVQVQCYIYYGDTHTQNVIR